MIAPIRRDSYFSLMVGLLKMVIADSGCLHLKIKSEQLLGVGGGKATTLTWDHQAHRVYYTLLTYLLTHSLHV
jgi:hypothetical protein